MAIKYHSIVFALVILSACGGGSEPNSETEANNQQSQAAQLIAATTETEAITVQPEQLSIEQQALSNAELNLIALTAYRNHAERVRAETGSYPVTKRSFRSAVGAFEDYAEAQSESENNIDLGLPTGETLSSAGRIVYRSDGTDYKLIAQRTGDCSVIRKNDPDLVDPKRDYGPGDCVAYGYWTQGAENW